MNKSIYLHLILGMTIVLNAVQAQTSTKSVLTWSELAPIPNHIGFAGSFAGISNGTLLVAGGANFPDGGASWTGSKKIWHDHIFALEKQGGKWKLAGKLPRALGYGASITWKNSLIIVGGSNAKGHYADVFQLKYVNGKIERTALPALPTAIANTSGVLIGDVIYIAGGIESADAKNAAQNFWALDLNAKQKAWKVLPTWPGPGRIFAVTGTMNGDFYLFSGGELINGNRNYLNDAYRYNPKTGWKRIADLPCPVVAAPSPAYALKQDLLVFGGDDGKLAAEAAILREKHPGFSTQVLAYNTFTDSWGIAAKIPSPAPVTTSLAIWNGNIIIPGGEVRPAVRTPKVLIIKSIN